MAFSTLILIITVNSSQVKKELNITWELDSPNGQPRYMIKTNGRFPAPSLVFEKNDDVEVCENQSPGDSFKR